MFFSLTNKDTAVMFCANHTSNGYVDIMAVGIKINQNLLKV